MKVGEEEEVKKEILDCIRESVNKEEGEGIEEWEGSILEGWEKTEK